MSGVESCLAAGTPSPLPNSLTPGRLLQRSLRSTSSRSLFTFRYTSDTSTLLSLFLHILSLFPQLPHGTRHGLRHNPSHALHDPVPVQTHPWLSSPLLTWFRNFVCNKIQKSAAHVVWPMLFPHLDLHLALFSAHSSFPLDLRSFWLVTFTWTRKRALDFWPTGIYVFFSGIYAYFPGKYAHNFGFKMRKVQKCQKWCNYARVGENRSKSRNLSNEHLFVFFRGYRHLLYFYCRWTMMGEIFKRFLSNTT